MPDLRVGEPGVEIDGRAVLVDGLFVPPREVEDESEVGVDGEGQRLEPLRALQFTDGLVEPSPRDQVHAVPVVRRRVAGLDGQGPVEFGLGARPVPVVQHLHQAQRRVGLDQRVVDPQGLDGRGPRLRHGLGRRPPAVVAEDGVAVGQPRIRPRVLRVFLDGLLEIADGLLHRGGGALLPEMTALQAQLVRLGALRMPPAQQLARRARGQRGLLVLGALAARRPRTSSRASARSR